MPPHLQYLVVEFPVRYMRFPVTVLAWLLVLPCRDGLTGDFCLVCVVGDGDGTGCSGARGLSGLSADPTSLVNDGIPQVHDILFIVLFTLVLAVAFVCRW